VTKIADNFGAIRDAIRALKPEPVRRDMTPAEVAAHLADGFGGGTVGPRVVGPCCGKPAGCVDYLSGKCKKALADGAFADSWDGMGDCG
jgi:hypothetical protein